MVLHARGSFHAALALSCTPVDLSMRPMRTVNLKQRASCWDHHAEKSRRNTTAEAQHIAIQELAGMHPNARFCEDGSGVGVFNYKDIEGNCEVNCGFQDEWSSYTGPVDGLSGGAHGVTVTMHAGKPPYPKVVAKLLRPNVTENRLEHECNILRILKNVEGVVTCEGYCENNGVPMIIIKPFLSETKKYRMKENFFKSPDHAHHAAVSMMQTCLAMLQAGVANRDQGHNVLFSKDGRATFIDMDQAVELRTVNASMINFEVTFFVRGLFDNIPTSWYWGEKKYGGNSRLDRVFQEICGENICLPTTPENVASKGINGTDLAKIFSDVATSKKKAALSRPRTKNGGCQIL